jgi:hypothetical protein
MAEPILGEGLALQSNWQPDTSKVITAGTGKLLDMDLKKQIAKQKAEEEKTKRLQQIASSIKVDVPKVNTHFLPEAQKLYTNAAAEILNASMSGDIAKKTEAEGRYKMLFNNLAIQSEAADNFLNAEKSGFIVPQEIKVAFSMPKEQGQAYLKEAISKKPELANLVNINEYGDYAFNTVKNLNLPKDLQSQINAMDNLFEATNQKRTNMTTRDEERLYKIPTATLRQEAKLISQDPEVVQNIMLKDRAALDANIKAFKAKNPLIAEDEALALATEKYVFDNLEARNNKYVQSNIPQEKGGGLAFNFGNGGALAFDMDGNPTNGVIPIQVEASTTTSGGRKVSKTFDRGVPTGNNYSFNTVEVLNTRGDGVLDMETNMPLEAKMLQSTKVGDVVAVPIATRDFVGSNGVNYKKGQMVDGKVLKTAMGKGLASYEPRVKGIAEYSGVDDFDKPVKIQKSVLIPAGLVRTGVISSQSGKNQEFINTLFDKAIQEANELNTKGRKGTKASTPQPSKKQSTPKTKDSFPTWKTKNPNGTAAQYKQYIQS